MRSKGRPVWVGELLASTTIQSITLPQRWTTPMVRPKDQTAAMEAASRAGTLPDEDRRAPDDLSGDDAPPADDQTASSAAGSTTVTAADEISDLGGSLPSATQSTPLAPSQVRAQIHDILLEIEQREGSVVSRIKALLAHL